MKTPKLETQGNEKRSSGKQGRRKFPFSSREIARPEDRPKVARKKLQRRQCRLHVELMEVESQLAEIKEKIKNMKESLSVVKIEANQSEAQLELLIRTRNKLITRRNKLIDKLLEMKTIETFLMHELGFL
ncbi:hypothetical protein DITRI_Ditri06bG0133000 [Diplodiscus trichospermus]